MKENHTEKILHQMKEDNEDDVNFCTIQDDCVVLRIRKGRECPDIDILLSKINTPEKLIYWMMHYSEKNWMTKKRIRLLCKVVGNHWGWRYTDR